MFIAWTLERIPIVALHVGDNPAGLLPQLGGYDKEDGKVFPSGTRDKWKRRDRAVKKEEHHRNRSNPHSKPSVIPFPEEECFSLQNYTDRAHMELGQKFAPVANTICVSVYLFIRDHKPLTLPTNTLIVQVIFPLCSLPSVILRPQRDGVLGWALTSQNPPWSPRENVSTVLSLDQ